MIVTTESEIDFVLSTKIKNLIENLDNYSKKEIKHHLLSLLYSLEDMKDNSYEN